MIKNILTNLMLIALTLCFSIGTYGQSVEKYIDLEILQLKYASNEVIPYGEEYLIEVAMINHGPDELLQGDFVLILESISPFSLYYPHGLAVGDTTTISVISFINSREVDEVYEACVWIQLEEELHENNFTLIDVRKQFAKFPLLNFLTKTSTSSRTLWHIGKAHRATSQKPTLPKSHNFSYVLHSFNKKLRTIFPIQQS